MHSNISQEEFKLDSDDDQIYFILNESIRAKDYQLSDIEHYRLTEHRKRIRQNEKQSLKLKTVVILLLQVYKNYRE